MELQKLQGFVLLVVLVGMIIGIGVLVTEKFGATQYYTYTFNDSIGTSVFANNSLTNLDHGNLSNIQSVRNGTAQSVFPTECYEINATAGQFSYRNISESCYGLANASVIYDYREYATATRNTMSSVGTEINGIASNWLGLIVTVAILSIVLFLVVRSFGATGRRQ